MNSLGNRIRYLRENRNITQRELANILNIANSTMSQYESDIRVPSDDIKIKIADYFHVTVDYLLGCPSNTAQNQTEDFPDEKVKTLAWEANDLSDVQLDLIRSMIKEFKEHNK